MKKQIYYLLASTFLLTPLAVHGAADDSKKGHSTPARKAKKATAPTDNQRLETLHKMILNPAIAQDPDRLAQVLKLYPGGEEVFFGACKENHALFHSFFNQIAGFTIENLVKDTEGVFRLGERKTYSRRTQDVEGVEGFQILFTNISPDAPPATQYYFKKLLEHVPEQQQLRHNSRGRRLDPMVIFVRNSSFYRALLQTEVKIHFLGNIRKAYDILEESVNSSTGARSKLVALRQAEIVLSAPSLFTNDKIQNAIKALSKVSKGNTPIEQQAQLRFAQNALGFFGPTPVNAEELKDNALEMLEQLTSVPYLSAPAYLLLLDHYLGVHNNQLDQEAAFNVFEKARHYLDDRYMIFFNLRIANLHMGIFNEDAPNIPEAINAFSQAGIYGMFPLYRIYAGEHGEEFKDQAKAEALFERGTQEGKSQFQMRKARMLINEGSYRPAIDILHDVTRKMKSLSPFCEYYMARIFSMPGEFYNPSEAINLFMEYSDIHDSAVRAVKLFNREMGVNFTFEALKRIGRGETTFDQEKARLDGPYLDVAVATEEVDGDGAGPASPDITAIAFEEDDITEEDITKEIDLEDPLVILNDEIENGMGYLHHPWKWRKLARFIGALGGIIDDEVITFPGIEEVFNFDRLHPANNEVNLSKGYWRTLKKHISMRYETLVQEKRAQMAGGAGPAE